MSELPDGLAPAEPPAPRDSALGIVVTRDTARPRVLLGLRARNSRFMPAYLAFPGGRLDEQDRPGDAGALARCVAREFREEIGLDLPVPAWRDAGERVTPPMFPARFRTRFFVAAWDAGAAAPLPANGENESLHLAEPGAVLADWERGDCLVPPPVLPILRLLAAGVEDSLDDLALRVARANAEEERAPRIEFHPGAWAVPLRTATLPPATHTNAWLVGGRRFLIVDPGADDESELARLRAVIARREALDDRPVAVVLTHGHRDHIGGAAATARALGVPLCAHPRALAAVAWGPGVTTRVLADGERIELGGVTLVVVATPGHDPAHLAFHLVEPRLLVAGDLVSGMSTILIDPERGDMDAYLDSLERVRQLGCRALLPGHGPALPASELARVHAHRLARERAVVDALAEGLEDLDAIARRAYQDTPVLPAPLGRRQTLAHLIRLERLGRVSRVESAAERWRSC